MKECKHVYLDQIDNDECLVCLECGKTMPMDDGNETPREDVRLDYQNEEGK